MITDRLDPQTENEIQQAAREAVRILVMALDPDNHECPICHAKMERRQVYRCVYAHPCGHRLYQGRIRHKRSAVPERSTP